MEPTGGNEKLWIPRGFVGSGGIGGAGKDVMGGAVALIVPVAGAELETTILGVELTLPPVLVNETNEKAFSALKSRIITRDKLWRERMMLAGERKGSDASLST